MIRATAIASIIACASACATADQPITMHDRLVRLSNRVYDIREQEMRDLILSVDWRDFEEIGKFYQKEANFEQRIRIVTVILNFALRDLRLTDIGVSVSLVPHWPEPPHFEIWHVKPQSSAAMAGLRKDDKIVALGDERVRSDMDWDAFRNYIRDRWWQEAEITVLRGEKEVKLRITVVGRVRLHKDDRFRNDVWKLLIHKRRLFRFADEWHKHFGSYSPITVPERWVSIMEEEGFFNDD